jgi:hypothetical protein
MKAEFNHKDRKKLFNTFVMVEHLMNKINENNHWRERLENLIDKHHVERKILGYGEANESI